MDGRDESEDRIGCKESYTVNIDATENKMNNTHFKLPKQYISILYPCGYQLTLICSSLSAVTMYFSSGVSSIAFRGETCPSTRMPLEGLVCEACGSLEAASFWAESSDEVKGV